MKITKELRRRIDAWAKTLMKLYGYAESTALKKAAAIERLLIRLRNEDVWIKFKNKKGEIIKIKATLVGYEELHRQSARNKFIIMYDGKAKKNGENGN